LIDGDHFSESESDLILSQSVAPVWQQQETGPSNARYSKSRVKEAPNKYKVTSTSANYFAKTNLYANSKLPLSLPPMKMYVANLNILGLYSHLIGIFQHFLFCA
jgi:hypothetical protein